MFGIYNILFIKMPCRKHLFGGSAPPALLKQTLMWQATATAAASLLDFTPPWTSPSLAVVAMNVIILHSWLATLDSRHPQSALPLCRFDCRQRSASPQSLHFNSQASKTVCSGVKATQKSSLIAFLDLRESLSCKGSKQALMR